MEEKWSNVNIMKKDGSGNKDRKEQPVVSGWPCYLWAMVRFQSKLLLR